MTIILAAVLIASTVAHYVYECVQVSRFDAERKAWAEERRELCSRIQAPDRIPVTPMPDFAVPEREPDEWNQVGQITISDKYGLDD